MPPVQSSGDGSGSLKHKPSFHIQYYGELDCKGRDVVYLDLYNFNPKDLKACRKTGTKTIIAYFTSQWSSWYPDSGGGCLGHGPDVCKNKFKQSYLGEDLPNWEGERFVNPKDPAVKKIMIERIELAKTKGFDGIDVDNTDMYSFKTGFNVTKDDTIEYINFFIDEAHKRDMLFSLKNTMTIMYSINKFDLAQNESCYKYRECNMYGKLDIPVFIISYKRFCPRNLYKKAYTIRKKKMNEKDKPCL